MSDNGGVVQLGKCLHCGRANIRAEEVIGVKVEYCDSVFGTGCSFRKGSDMSKQCRCGKRECKILTSKREHSRGHKFFCYPQSSGPNNHGCRMFQWVSEEGGSSSSNAVDVSADDCSINPHGNILSPSTMYARGYLEASIRGSEQHTQALKGVLAALNKLDVNMQ